LRIFKTKWFARFARKEGIEDNKLLDAIREAEKGVSVIDLGGGLIKKRVSRSGRGKSGGYRTIIFSDKDIAKALNAGELMEIDAHGQKIQK
jgi:hypothetical protein